MNEEIPDKAPSDQLFVKEGDNFQLVAISSIENMSKLQRYALIKKDTSFEDYLTFVQNTSDRIAMSKFRLSNHTLLIETGRHQGIPAPERKCPFCPEHIEDEFHFLINCPTYNTLRNNLFLLL